MDSHAGQTLDFASSILDDDDNDDDIYNNRSSATSVNEFRHDTNPVGRDDSRVGGGDELRPVMAHSRAYSAAGDAGQGGVGIGVGVGSNGGGGGTVRRILRFFVRTLSRGGHASYRELSMRSMPGVVVDGSEPLTPMVDEFGFGDADVDADVDADEVATSCMASLRQMLLSSWLNTLLVFVPIGIVTYLTHTSPIAIFATNAIAVIPLSSLLTAATERVASDAGDTVGALLNISLGNLVELILFIVALVNNQVRVVQASILGSILVNSLLILGTALLATGLTDNEPVYNTAETQLLSCLLFASVFVFLMPTAFGYTFDKSKHVSKATLQMSRVSSLMVLLIYLLYFVHELRARPIAAGHANGAGSGSGSGSTSDDDSERGLSTPTTPTTPTAASTATPTTASARPVVLVSSSSTSTPECQQVASASVVVINSAAVPQPRSVRFADAVSSTHPVKPTLSSSSSSLSSSSNGIEMHRMDDFDMNSNTTPSRPYPHAHTRMHSHSHSRSISVDSIRAGVRRSRASSLSGGAGGAGVGGGMSSSGGPGSGFTAISGPGLMRSGITALQIMRDNQQQAQAQQASRVSLESSGSAADRASLLRDGGAPSYHHGDLHPPAQRRRGEFIMAVIVLIVASALMSVNAQFLVDTIDDVTHQGHLSESVIGLIILPIVGNIAEYVTVVSVALRDKLDLAISVAIGSSIQIALCVTPLTVGAGWILNRNLSLTFTFFEMAALVGTALLVGLLVSSDGDRKLRTCGLKGALMCACYVIIGLGAYLSPNVAPK
ncbi:calcium/proton exchanger [Sporothrix schenckii ATCC 58251]|uniref:Calcium/proton exchanger n=1 Tax=Sporothrix schenckii (strain ATCC 58251 / de Perez 2211183) TaxID=1391915 RepID=U7PSM3_SPOS1|nr:calcium/proton exchanger [Sporothrix schenckii ATCC 58251]